MHGGNDPPPPPVAYMVNHLGYKHEEAVEKATELYYAHGTTLAGLVHKVRPRVYPVPFLPCPRVPPQLGHVLRRFINSCPHVALGGGYRTEDREIR